VAQATLPHPRTKVVLLGTKGGPSPSLDAGEPSNLLVVDGVPYLVDCGYGCIFSMLKAGYSCEQLPAVFVTHQHFDHNADLGTVLMTAWQRGINHPIEVVAPTPVKKMIEGYLAFSNPDIQVRIREEGRKPLAPLIKIKEISDGGLVYQDERIKVTAMLVDHYTVKPALAYRFETPDRTIVFSGDTTYFPKLADFARGADVLVHEVLYLPAIDSQPVTKGAPTMRDHILRSHTSAENVGKIAQAANVKMVVLSHLVPFSKKITDSMWIDRVRHHFNGEVLVAHDGMIV